MQSEKIPGRECSGMEEILKFENISISYDDRTIIKNMSFSLKKGEFLGISGESGCGKSTLLKAVMGILDPSGRVTSGKIIYNGTNLLSLSDSQLRKINGSRIAMIFQDTGTSFCPVRVMGAQMFEGLRAHEKITKNEFHRRALEMLRQLNFDDADRVLKSYPFELSGGMLQRVGIASAMLTSPDILLADEPTSALDKKSEKIVSSLLAKMNDLYKTSIIMVSHNAELLEELSDRVVKVIKI